MMFVSTYRERDSWIRDLCAAGNLSVAARLVGVRLGQFLEPKTGLCNGAGYDELAKAVALKRRAVINAVAALKAFGWIEGDRSRGWHANTFRLIARTTKTVHADAPFGGCETVHPGAPFGAETVHGGAPFGAETVHGSAPFTTGDTLQTVHGDALFAAKKVHGGDTQSENGAPPCTQLEEREEKREGAQARPSPPRRQARQAKQDRGTRLPSNWKPSAADLAYAARKGLDPTAIANEAEKFQNHWLAKAGADAKKTDWSATWRIWIIRSAEYRTEKSPHNSRPKNGAAAPDPKEFTPGQWEARVKRWKETGQWLPDWGPSPGAPGCLAPEDVIRSDRPP
jgi:hypothetical protein